MTVTSIITLKYIKFSSFFIFFPTEMNTTNTNSLFANQSAHHEQTVTKLQIPDQILQSLPNESKARFVVFEE